MKFLDINGVEVLWNKIKDSFIPYNPNGISKTIPSGQQLTFQVAANDTTNTVDTYVNIGRNGLSWYVTDVDTANDETVHSAYIGATITQGGKANFTLNDVNSIEESTGNVSTRVELNSDEVCIISYANYLFHAKRNVVDLLQDGADYRINGISIVPEAIEDTWLESNLT